jgi:hypothetical protein
MPKHRSRFRLAIEIVVRARPCSLFFADFTALKILVRNPG